MLRARKTGVLTTCIFFVENDAATIFMERIDGQSVRDVLLSGNLTPAGVSASAISLRPAKTYPMCSVTLPQIFAFLASWTACCLQTLMPFFKRLDTYWPLCMTAA